jgi:hypothetical protein
MPSPLYPPSRPQSPGQVLDAAFRIFQATLVKCLPYGIFTMIAAQVPSIHRLVSGTSANVLDGADPLGTALLIASALAALISSAALLLRQHRMINGRETSARIEVGTAVRRAPALIALLALALLAIGLAIAARWLPEAQRLIGLIVLVPGALCLNIVLSVAWPALLVEQHGLVAATRRGFHLVTGNWWRAALVLAMAAVTAAAFYFVAVVILGIVLQLAGASDLAMFTAVIAVVLASLGAIGAPFYGAILLALHADLTLRREGSDIASRLAGAAAD